MKQHTLPAHDLQEREIEGETPPGQEGEGMAPPQQHRALPAQGTQEIEGGNPPTWRGKRRWERIQTGKRMQGRTDRKGNSRWHTSPIRGERDARRVGVDYSC